MGSGVSHRCHPHALGTRTGTARHHRQRRPADRDEQSPTGSGRVDGPDPTHSASRTGPRTAGAYHHDTPDDHHHDESAAIAGEHNQDKSAAIATAGDHNDTPAGILGYTSGRAVLDHLYKRPPGYFPDPDHIGELPFGRHRRRWRRRTILVWAATRDRRGRGCPPGTPHPGTMRTEYPYATDPAYPFALARLRAGHSLTRPQPAAGPSMSVEKARRVLRAARPPGPHPLRAPL
ncbi:MAG: hypothetical protein ACRDR6_12110 [Pseudonocardiaceae bacterium]